MTQRVSGMQTDPFDNDIKIEPVKFRVICPILIVSPKAGHPVAERTLHTERIVTECWYVSGGADDAYAAWLTKYWQKGDTFINVEHDVAPWPGLMDQMNKCDMPWCFCPSMSPKGWLVTGLSCMKFGASMIEQIPKSWEDWGMVPWWDLDGALISDLKEAGFTPHEHTPPVAHARRPIGTRI